MFLLYAYLVTPVTNISINELIQEGNKFIREDPADGKTIFINRIEFIENNREKPLICIANGPEKNITLTKEGQDRIKGKNNYRTRDI